MGWLLRIIARLRYGPSQRGRFCDLCGRWYPEGMGPHWCMPRRQHIYTTNQPMFWPSTLEAAVPDHLVPRD